MAAARPRPDHPAGDTLAETADVDDQAAWLDPRTVMYAKDGDIWAVPADGTGAPDS
nr:hypothetical protein GCM10020093_053180 [Planobispora longispora]